MKRFACSLTLAAIAALPATRLARSPPRASRTATSSRPTNTCSAAWLVLRQENLDFKEGFKWNEIIHRAPGGVDWANPNLDVVYSEAWMALDEKSCTLIEIPEIKGRYYTVQALNGWGEVTANINERNFPKHPFGQIRLLSQEDDRRRCRRARNA